MVSSPDPPDAGRVRPPRAGAGLAGRRGAAACAGTAAPRAPRAALLHALRRQPGAVCLRARAEGDLQQVRYFNSVNLN